MSSHFFMLLKQSSGDVLYGVLKRCFKKLRKIHRKTPVPEPVFNRQTILSLQLYFKKNDSGEIFKSTFFTDHLQWLRLYYVNFLSTLNPFMFLFLQKNLDGISPIIYDKIPPHFPFLFKWKGHCSHLLKVGLKENLHQVLYRFFLELDDQECRTCF